MSPYKYSSTYPGKSHTMRIIKPLTEEHSQTALGTAFRAMHGLETYKTTIGSETQVGVGTSQAR
jgi:hypothetical protein